ncbi:hypothetical protein A1O1_09235 [Capronia coronata CBS 617.96]|uniref:Uncharacterized protein n=1 Tax=Capronia coronata CBS 617.96 TaxID=1182541 RepID=W9XF73_9EURO|nr:uncharacterized protein A1O1_09235 [Capronia coronata CBS 617.96]EXJ78833.1 hypothetical protein A1O1_09235 [Capronia coronata CBS 617.96]
MGKVQVHEHTLSYQAISPKSPYGLRCLKTLFTEYDNAEPSRLSLNSLLSKDFQDNENGNDRSVGRDEAIESIISSRARCSRHQIDLKYACCIEHSTSRQTVFFEAVRFMVVNGDSDWRRIPISGRLEVRIKDNMFSLRDAVAEIVSRRMTSDTSQLLRKDLSRTSSTPLSPAESPMSIVGRSTSQSALTGSGATELPGISTTSIDNRTLPPYQSPTAGTPTFASGSSTDGEQTLKL